MIYYTRLACLSLLLATLVTACASKPPHAISKIPAHNPSLTRVLLDLDSFIGTEVRWGGEITRVENRAEQTWIEIVRRELHDNGKPESSGKSDGRFIASFAGFVDPVVYEVGHRLTVVGTIDDKIKRPIGDFDYTFPIVSVEGSYLWKTASEAAVPYYPGPWWYYDVHYYHPGYYPRHRHYH
jgi:outer membrane lipoprotein